MAVPARRMSFLAEMQYGQYVLLKITTGYVEMACSTRDFTSREVEFALAFLFPMVKRGLVVNVEIVFSLKGGW